MSVRGAGGIPKAKFPSPPKLKLPKEPTIKGPGVPKMKAPGVEKIPTLPSLQIQARRGLTPKLQLAKAAAGASSNTSKRNSYYPTP
ncbi:MAG TPA: hypothetical protein VFH56_08755 [Acidimicrobiales bacterium]|nr:hypothetical protein [Acidimicrobiales bacterium]